MLEKIIKKKGIKNFDKFEKKVNEEIKDEMM